MRSVTTPLFPAQLEGAVTLQAVMDAREGDRLPLDLALYVSGELGKQVVELQKLGREGSLDPKRVWCTSKGAVVVHEAAPGEARALGSLVYRLLSGSGDVSAWPPSYFNPSVAESVDVAVMAALAGEKPEDTKAMVEALNAAASGLDQEASVTGMARLVFAVSDEPKAPASPARARSISIELERFAAPPSPEWVAAARAWLTPLNAAVVGGAVLVILAGSIGIAVSGPSKAAPVVEAVSEPAPVASPLTIREQTVAAFKAQKLLKTASAKAASSKKGHAKK